MPPERRPVPQHRAGGFRAPLQWLVGAETVAVFGASDRPGIPEVLLANLARNARVRVVGINPNRREAHGVPCVPHVRDAPEAIDAAVMLLADRRVETAIEEALEAGIRCLVVPGLAYSPERQPMLDRIAAVVGSAGALMLGPDCMGVVSDAGASPWIGTLPAAERAHKSVAIVSQSGAVAEAVIAAGDRLGLSLVVSVGSEATFDVADACDHLGATEGTRAVGLFLETVRRPRELQRALERLAERDVPVVCLKTGASRAAAAGAHAHSGADAGDVDAFAAFARSSGIIVAPHFAAFMETLVLLQATRRPRGARVAAVTNSGGEAQLLADEGEAAGLRFDPVSPDTARALGAVRPRPLPALNPLDAWCGDAVDETFRATLDILAGSGDYDVLVGLVDQSPHITGLEIGNGLALAGALVAAAEAHGLPAAIVSSLASEPVPAIAELAAAHDAALLRTISSALAAIAAVGRWASHRAARSLDAVRVGARLADLRVDHRLDPHYGPYVKVSTPGGDQALALTPLSVAVAATLLLDLGASGDPGAFAAGIGAPEALARPTAAG